MKESRGADSNQLCTKNADAGSDDEVRPLMVQTNDTLTVTEVYDILSYATSKYEEYISNEPPVQPKGGSVFLFDLGDDNRE